MSQSSVSEALAKLRHLFNDELLVSSGTQMTLTAVARRIEPLLESSLDSVSTFVKSDSLLRAGPRTAIDVAVNDYLILVLGVDLIARLREERPDVTIRFHEVDHRSAARLRSGDLDFMITPEVSLSPGDAQFERRLIFEDRVICLLDAKSPIDGIVTPEEYWSAPHVFFSPKSEIYGAIGTTILQQLGEKRSDSTLVQSYLLVPFLVENTDAIALAHESLAKVLLPSAKVKIAEAPFDIPVRIFLTRDASRAPDPLQTWFSDLVTDVARRAQAQTF